jgi:hypothetical protein
MEKICNRINSDKPSERELLELIAKGKQLIFDIPWLRDIGEELEKW